MAPEGWLETKLSDIADYRRGSFPQPYGLDKWFDAYGHPFVQVYDVDKNLRLKAETKAKISDLAAEKSVFAPKGTILITLQGSIGRIAITQYSAYVDRTLLVIREFKIPGDQYYFALSLQVLFDIEKKKAPGGTIKTITKAVLNNFTIPWPPLPEQRKIAKILQTWDRSITTTEKLIDASKQQKKALMQQLLTGKKRFAGFEGEWEEARLEKHIHFLSGFAFKSAEFEKGTKHKLLRGINISRGFLRWTPESTFTWSDTENYLKYQLEVNDLVISMDGSLVGRNYALITPDNFELMLLVQRVARLRCKKSLSHAYLCVHISSAKFTSFVDAVKTVTAIPHISAKDIKNFEIPLPTITEQLKISTVLSNSDKEIEKLNLKLTHLKQEKKSLMQQLLTGKRRVKIDD